jgi:hypothetical protein
MDADTLERARIAFDTVLGPRDDAAPFRATVPARLLMYPIDYTMLDGLQFGAIAAAAATAAGEQEAFLAPLGGRGEGWEGTYDHAVVGLHDYACYKPERDTLVLEHALFSPSGAWAVVTSDAEDAAVAGSSAFIDALRAHLPADDRDMTRRFIGDVRDSGQHGARVDWLEPYIEHLYGPEAATLLGPARSG